MSRTTSSAFATLTALDGPALLPPPGVTSHLTNSSSQQNWYYVFISLCTVIPGVLLLLRLYTKIRIVRKLDLTDCLYHLTLSLTHPLIRIYRYHYFRICTNADIVLLCEWDSNTDLKLFMIGLIVIGREIIDEGGAVHQWNVQLKHLIKMQFVWLHNDSDQNMY